MDDRPLFAAISTSARQLYLLLRCIAFAPKAEVHITAAGIRFSVEESHVVQGSAFVEASLFSSYNLNVTDAQPSIPSFQISITALLETLQIFGISEANTSYRNQSGGFSSSYAAAFTTPALAMGGTCRISYAQIGAPLSITIQESGMNTTCEMNTYDITGEYDDAEGIPLDRNALVLKVIMRSAWLHDAVTEIAGTSPTMLVVNASSQSAPYFALEGHGGPFGDTTVDFQPEAKNEPTPSTIRAKKQPLVTETFSVAAPSGNRGRVKQSYKFDLIQKAARAMALASKVSVRQDRQGVLSLQFMIEVNEGVPGTSNGGVADSMGHVSFVDFRFVPLVDEDEDDHGGEESDEYDDAGSASSVG